MVTESAQSISIVSTRKHNREIEQKSILDLSRLKINEQPIYTISKTGNIDEILENSQQPI